MKVRDLIRLLKQDGWAESRSSGSHRVFKHSTKRGIVIVSVHSGDVPLGTLRAILKQAGVEEPK